jgi:hypothetical protein
MTISNHALPTHFTKNKYTITAKARQEKSVILLHLLPCFLSSRPHMHRQYESESPEIIDRFGNNKGALR